MNCGGQKGSEHFLPLGQLNCIREAFLESLHVIKGTLSSTLGINTRVHEAQE